MAEKLTNDQIQERADQLTQELSVKVHPIVFMDPDTEEQVVGYIKEPNRMTKLRVMDKGLSSPMSAAAELMEIVLIKEASDPRIYSEQSEHDNFYLGAVNAAYETIKMSVNQFKKK